MKKIKYTIGDIAHFIVILFIAFSIYTWSTPDEKDRYNTYSSIITFLSIEVGFCITALTVIAASNFAHQLYECESAKDNSINLLSEFILQFKKAIHYSLATIISILIYFFFGSNFTTPIKIQAYEFNFNDLMNIFIWVLFFESIQYFYKLFNQFCQFVRQEAKLKK